MADSVAHMPRQPEPEFMDLADEAAAYIRADFNTVNAAFVDRLLELAGQQPRALSVDLGTGPADIPLRICKQRPRWQVVAVDASMAMLAHVWQTVAATQPRMQILPLLADAKRLPLASQSCDIVMSNSILHHVSDPAPLWCETRRILKPGGLVFFRDLARPVDVQTARRIVEQHAGNESPLLQEEYYRSLLAAYTPEEVRSQLARAGLHGLRCEMSTDRHLDIFGRISDPKG